MTERLITNPANRQYIERIADELGTKHETPPGLFGSFGWPLEITYNSSMPESEPTGRIIAPDGSVAKREGWSWQWDRFTVLGEGSLPWLLGLDMVKREMTPLFYVVKMPIFRSPFGFPVVPSPRSFILGTWA